MQQFKNYINGKFTESKSGKSFKSVNPSTEKDLNSNDYRRLVYDEIFSNLIYLFTSRKIVRTKKKLKYLRQNKIS